MIPGRLSDEHDQRKSSVACLLRTTTSPAAHEHRDIPETRRNLPQLKIQTQPNYVEPYTLIPGVNRCKSLDDEFIDEDTGSSPSPILPENPSRLSTISSRHSVDSLDNILPRGGSISDSVTSVKRRLSRTSIARALKQLSTISLP
eukprot:81621_1